MKKITKYQNKEVLILGLARSGYATAKCLYKLGAKCTVNDAADLKDDPKAQELKTLGMTVIGGSHPPDLLDHPFDLIVKNPGIPYSNPVIAQAVEKKIPVITEIEIASEISEAEFVAVTGSNGKTTTTTLIGEMMKNGKYHPIVAGNIGTVLTDVAQEATPADRLIAELSSFQLMGTENFRPSIAVLLNLFEAHLDYHGSFEAYGKAKYKITENQTESEKLIYNADDGNIKTLALNSKAEKIPFSLEEKLIDGAYLSDGMIFYKGSEVLAISEFAMPKGEHNIANALAAAAAALEAGATLASVRQALRTFTGVRHRLQYVAEHNGRRFYNDSKATNILATQKALQSFSDPVVLIAGGLDRGNDFDGLIPSLEGVKACVLYGETKEKLAEAANRAGVKQVGLTETLEKAVEKAYDFSAEGDVVLLSPACASWDQFPSFETRGDMFVQCVHKMN